MINKQFRFRVKRTDGEWEFINLPHDLHGDIYMSEEAYDWSTLGQFTNIVDKHQTPIFSGDLVKFEGRVSEVIFSDHFGCYGLKKEISTWEKPFNNLVGHNGSSTSYSPYLWGYLRKKVEIVGNVYDTPELLTPTSK